MFRFRRWPALLTVLLAIAPATVRWLRSTLPLAADIEIHLLRALQLDLQLFSESLYPRFQPDLVFGFGYPLFNFNSALPNGLIVLVHRLGASMVDSTLLVYAAADIVAALGAWLLVRRAFSPEAGVLAAAAYVWHPYVLGTVVRGSIGETWALAVFPWMLLAFYELTQRPSQRWLAAASVSFALFPLLHNPSSVTASATLGALLVALQLWQWRAGTLVRHWYAPWLAIGTGLALSAFFWLPVAAEVQFIQIERAYEHPALNYNLNYLTLETLFALPQVFDPQVIGWSPRHSIGLAHVGLGLLALLGWRKQTPVQRLLLVLALLGSALLALFSLEITDWWWDNVPGISLIQHPSRVLMPVSLLLAIVAGASVDLWHSARARSAALAGGVLLLMAVNLPWSFNFDDPTVPPNPALPDVHALERELGAIGLNTAGEYRPVWVRTLPDPDTLTGCYAGDGPPCARLDRASLPDGAAVLSDVPGTLSQHVQVNLPHDALLTFNLFYFPGWLARVDGEPVPLRVSSPGGLVQVPVPAGRHTVALRFGTTPVRVAGSAISIVALVAVAALLWRGRRTDDSTASEAEPLRWRMLAPAAAVALLFLVFVMTLVRGYATPYARSRLTAAGISGANTPLDLAFADQMLLRAADLPDAQVAGGGELPVDLFWQVPQSLEVDYSSAVWLADASGLRYGQSDSQHIAGLPTTLWRTDQYGHDHHVLVVDAGTPPGTYRLLVTAYRQDTGAALSPGVELGTVTVIPPAQVPAPPVDEVDDDLPLNLLAASISTVETGVGEPLAVFTTWRASDAPGRDIDVRLLLGDDEIATLDVPLSAAWANYPASAWRAGELMQARTVVTIPVDWPAGDYPVAVVVDDAGEISAHQIGMLAVVAPDRRYTPPLPAVPLDARFGDVAALAGYTLDGDTLRLDWQALATADRPWTLFVHFLAADGTMLAQVDRTPGDGQRPTTTWLPGEYLSDSLPMPADAAVDQIRIGLYDQASGERLLRDDGSDSLLIAP